MKNLFILLAVIMSLSVASFVHADAGADTPQSLYLKAGKEERQGDTGKACQTYEAIIDRFPDSEFAVKANDRLLAISPLLRATSAPPAAVAPQAPSEAGSQAPAAPGIAPTPILEPQPPLPTDPIKKRGVELARLYEKARGVHDLEYSRHQFAFTTQHGHKYIHSELSLKQQEWKKIADQKVMKEFGSSLVDIRQKMQQACQDAGITGTCNEEAFRR